MDIFEKLLYGKSLTFDEAKELSGLFLSNELSDIKKASVLTALKIKGETPEEIAGFASGMREHSVKINNPDFDYIDVCGTGGDSSGTFNISTTVAFVVAGAGIKIAKHGNRSISSKSGSADVLKSLNVNVEMTPEQSDKLLKEIGIAFLFAPVYHPAMRFVAPVRRELATKTIFNMLGPLTNPAETTRQLIGTFDENASEKMCAAAEYLNFEKVNFICTENKFDEITLTGNTSLLTYEKNKEHIKTLLLASDFGYNEVTLSDLRGGNPHENAGILRDILNSEKRSPKTDVVCANAALAFEVAGKVDTIKQGVELAEETLFSKEANTKLEELIDNSL